MKSNNGKAKKLRATSTAEEGEKKGKDLYPITFSLKASARNEVFCWTIFYLSDCVVSGHL
jgi:hypothetical protein